MSKINRRLMCKLILTSPFIWKELFYNVCSASTEINTSNNKYKFNIIDRTKIGYDVTSKLNELLALEKISYKGYQIMAKEIIDIMKNLPKDYNQYNPHFRPLESQLEKFISSNNPQIISPENLVGFTNLFERDATYGLEQAGFRIRDEDGGTALGIALITFKSFLEQNGTLLKGSMKEYLKKEYKIEEIKHCNQNNTRMGRDGGISEFYSADGNIISRILFYHYDNDPLYATVVNIHELYHLTQKKIIQLQKRIIYEQVKQKNSQGDILTTPFLKIPDRIENIKKKGFNVKQVQDFFDRNFDFFVYHKMIKEGLAYTGQQKIFKDVSLEQMGLKENKVAPLLYGNLYFISILDAFKWIKIDDPVYRIGVGLGYLFYDDKDTVNRILNNIEKTPDIIMNKYK